MVSKKIFHMNENTKKSSDLKKNLNFCIFFEKKKCYGVKSSL